MNKNFELIKLIYDIDPNVIDQDNYRYRIPGLRYFNEEL